MIRHLLVLALSCLLVTACGFHLRGPRPLPFASIYLAMDNYAELTVALKRQIRSTGTTRIAEKPEEAELILQVGRNDREKNILSLNAKGTVREYQLKQRFGFRLIGRDGREVTPLSEIAITRDVSFNDSDALAKEQEEQVLFRDMENDLVQQLMRRLSASRLPPEPAPAGTP
ncbi:MAG: hypothetical protein IPL70_00490 [Uliginosibacterium sp.]|nr:hypothetical protein [Uliginosibacterium sp.]